MEILHQCLEATEVSSNTEGGASLPIFPLKSRR